MGTHSVEQLLAKRKPASNGGAVSRSPNTSSESTPTTTRETLRLEISHLRRVWERMAAIFGAKWVSTMGPSPQTPDGVLTTFGDTWERGLRMFGPLPIAAGLEACLSRPDPWPPSLPEFRLMCLQVPTLPQVRRQIREEVQTFTPFTLMVYRNLDAYIYRRSDTRMAETMLREAYEEATAALLRGEKPPELAGLVEHKVEAPRSASPETVATALAEMRRALGVPHE